MLGEGWVGKHRAHRIAPRVNQGSSRRGFGRTAWVTIGDRRLDDGLIAAGALRDDDALLASALGRIIDNAIVCV